MYNLLTYFYPFGAKSFDEFYDLSINHTNPYAVHVSLSDFMSIQNMLLQQKKNIKIKAKFLFKTSNETKAK